MRRLLAAAAIVLAAAGCSDAESSSDPAGPVVVEVTFADGTVTPIGEKVEVAIGHDVEFVVTSDVEDELHVHGEPELTIEVEPGADGAVSTYTPTVPGRIAVEAHHADVTVATLVATR